MKKISLGNPMTKDDIIENIVATNQSKGSVLAVLSELDVQIEAGLKSGRIVRLPNGIRFEPIGKLSAQPVRSGDYNNAQREPTP